MNRIYVFSILFLFSISLFSQEMKLYAPFPSRIETVVTGSRVQISWKDTADIENGRYEIYRGATPLTADNLHLAIKVGDSQQGIQNFTETPPVGEDLYYAVFAADSSQVYKICIPYRNVTTSPVRIDEPDPEEQRSTRISELSYSVLDEDVILSLSSSKADRDVIYFRSISMINSVEKLKSAIQVGTESGLRQEFTDNPMAGIPYYYAAVDSGLYRSGSDNLLYDGNYTTEALEVKFPHQIEEDDSFSKSIMPLPLLKITADLESGETLLKEMPIPEGHNISDENLRAVERLIRKTAPLYEAVEPAVLSYNRNINSIVSGDFLNGKWQETIDKLEEFTSLKYDESTRIQSHFYRGQSYFRLGDYNRAMVEFIMVEKDLYRETAPFFHAIYRIKKTSLP